MRPSSILARRALSRPFPASVLQCRKQASPLLQQKFTPFLRYASAQPFQPKFPQHKPADPSSSLTVSEEGQIVAPERPPQPSYQLSFTCKPCGHRSNHTISKQGYHHGTVLVACPGCKSRHLIADHLKIFVDERSTLEDILKKKLGEGFDVKKMLKKGRLGMRPGALMANEGEEDIEFWDDGSESTHETTNEKPSGESGQT